MKDSAALVLTAVRCRGLHDEGLARAMPEQVATLTPTLTLSAGESLRSPPWSLLAQEREGVSDRAAAGGCVRNRSGPSEPSAAKAPTVSIANWDSGGNGGLNGSRGARPAATETTTREIRRTDP